MYVNYILAGFVFFLISFTILFATIWNANKTKNPLLKGIIATGVLIIGIVIMFANIQKLDSIASLSQNEEIYFVNATLYAENQYEWIFMDDNGDLWSWGQEDGIIYTYGTSYLLSINNNGTYDTNTDDILLIIWQEGGEQIYYG